MRSCKVKYLIVAIVLLPLSLSATEPDENSSSQKPPSDRDLNGSSKADVYTKFKKRVGDLSVSDRSKLKVTYKKKIDDAADVNHFEEATYYNRLYEILSSFE
jgi:hypothetical protein